MLTARGQVITRQEAAASGANLVLTKPFSPTQLLAGSGPPGGPAGASGKRSSRGLCPHESDPSLFIMVDACGWEILRDDPFLQKVAP